MPLQAVCPNCETGHNLADDKVGKKIRCKSCKEPFTVEAAEKAKPAGGGIVEVACPHCETTLRLRPEMLGKKVRCKKCQETFTAKTENEEEEEEEEEKTTSVTAKAPKGKPSSKGKKNNDEDEDEDADDEEEDDEDDEDDNPKSKKGKKKKKGGSSVMMLAIAGGGGALLLIIVVAVVIMMTRGGGSPNKDVVAKNDSAKTDDSKKKADDNKIVNPVKDKIDPLKDGKVSDNKSDDKGKTKAVISDPKDPVVINLKQLRLDIVTKQAEINAAIRWFRDDPKKTKLNHPLRPEVSHAFQLLVDHPDFKLFDDCWYCYTDWVTSDDEEVKQLEVHLTRAPKTLYRELIMHALARIKTEESCRVLATTFPSQEHALAVKLFRDIGPELGAKPVFPYVYYNDKFARDAAYALLKGYSETERKEIKNGVVVKQYKKGEILKEKIGYKTIDEIPRLPVSKHELAVEKAIDDIKGDDRLQKLAAIDFLQKERLKPALWEDVSKVLDPFIIDKKDQFIRTNALIALERWVHKQNISNLQAGVTTPALKDDHYLMLTTLTKVPEKDAGKSIVAFYISLKDYPEYRKVLVDYLLKLGDEDAQRDLLKQFNAKDTMCKDVARKGVLKFQKENKRITDDDLIEQCASDVGGDPVVSANALSWLATTSAPVHSDNKLRGEIRMRLVELGKTEITKDTPPEKAAEVRLANDALRNISARMQTIKSN